MLMLMSLETLYKMPICGSENSVARCSLDASNWFDYHNSCTFFFYYLSNSKITIPKDLWLNMSKEHFLKL